MENNIPTQDAVESPSADNLGTDANTEVNAPESLNDVAANFLFGDSPQMSENLEELVTEDSEAVTDEYDDNEVVEEQSADTAEVDSPDEAEEGDVVDESGHDDVEEFVDFNEIKDMHLEIGGKYYTGAQLKSMLGRLESAGTDARKAAQTTEELTQRETQIAEREAWLEQRTNAAAKSDQLLEMQSEARKISAAIEQARSDGDMYEVTLQKDKLEVLKQNYATASREVQQVQQRQEAEQVAKAEAGLRDRGLGYLLQDGPQAKAWLDYASKQLSEQELRVATMVPAVAEMIEKARKYDTAQKAPKRKLKTSGKTLKSGANKPIVSRSEKEKQALANDPDAAFNDIASRMLGL